MNLNKATGIILKKKEVNEKDIIIEVILKTRENIYTKKKFIIHGILKSKKRNPIIAEIGNLVSIDFYNKPDNEILNIKEINLIDRFDELKTNYEDFYLTSFILGISYYASLSDNSLKELYILLLSALNFLKSYKKEPGSYSEILNFINKYKIQLKNLVFLFYILRILKIMGYIGDLNFCTHCNKPIIEKAKWQKEIYFFCEHCDSTANKIDFIYLQIIKFTNQYKFNIFIKKLEELINQFHLQNDFLQFIEPMENKIELYLKEIFNHYNTNRIRIFH